MRDLLNRFWRAPELPAEVQAYLDALRPDQRLPWRALPYSVLDVETSGLDPRRDALLAIGLVEIDAGRVRLDRTWQTLVRPPDGLLVPAETIRIHQILRGDVADAPPLIAVLPELLRRLRGRVLVVHVAAIDIGFLDRALRQCYGIVLRGPAIDTARMAAARHADEQFLGGYGSADAPPLALRALAERAGLPVYAEHNALDDALTTAQLFLVQASQRDGCRAATLRELLRRGGCVW